MLSKQKTKNLFNNQYIKRVDNIWNNIEANSTQVSKVKISSIRIKNSKYFMIKLPNSNNPMNKTHIRLNLNTLPRPNYENGSEEMYRQVNGLCQCCGHDEFNGKLTFSKTGYALSNISCTKCNAKQP